MVKKSKVWNSFMNMPESGVVLGIISLLIILAIFTRGQWFTINTFQSIFKTTAIIGIIAIGQTYLIISGEIDLSVGSVFAFIGIMYSLIIKTLIPIGAITGLLLSFLIVMLLGLSIGLFHSFLVNKMEIPSLVVTIGSLFVFRGIANGIGEAWGLPYPHGARNNILSSILGEGSFLGFRISIIWLIIFTIIFSVILSYTRYGNHLTAVGRDPTTALSLGISPTKTKLIAFLICSALVSFAAILNVADTRYAYCAAGNDFPLESIAAAVLGGAVVVGGGIGSVWGSVLGVLLLSSVRTGLIMIGAPPYWYITFVGIVLILMMTIKMKRR